LAEATALLKTLGVTLNADKTRIVHVQVGFEFLGYKIKRGTRPLRLAPGKIRSGVRSGDLYAYPRQKSIQHFKDQIRQHTRRKAQRKRGVTDRPDLRRTAPVLDPTDERKVETEHGQAREAPAPERAGNR
jgi:hypothetical protein